MKKSSNTVVIGAGISGLTAAYNLRKLNKNVIVLEKENKVGGRAKVEKKDDFILDTSAQFIFEDFYNFFDIVREVKISNNIIPTNSNIAFYRNKKFHVLNLLGIIKFGSIKEKYKILRLLNILRKHDKNFSYTNLQKSKEFDSEIFSKWINHHFGDSILEYFVQPIVSSLCLSHPEKLSASYGLTLLNSSLRKEIYAISNGIGSVSEKLKDNIGKKYVKTSSEVKKIEIDGNKINGVELKDDFIDASFVISSIPPPVLSKIAKLPNEMKKLIKEIDYSPCIHLWICLNEPIWKNSMAILFPRIEWKDHIAIIETSLKSKTHVPSGKSMIEVFVFEDHARQLLKMDNEKIKEKILDDLNNFFVHIKKKVLWYKILKIKYGMPIYKPRYHELVKKLNKKWIEGLVLCGDYMAMPSLETAVWSGKNAAKVIIRGDKK